MVPNAGRRDPLFDETSFLVMHELSKGLPRKINSLAVLTENLMFAGFIELEKSLVTTLFSFGNFLASATGPSSSGGGKGVVCRDTKGKVLSVELLDLWEARAFPGHNERVVVG